MPDSFTFRAWGIQLKVWPSPGTAKCPEPLCPQPALPTAARRHAPCQRALPLLPRSYGLMRQTKFLRPTSVVPNSADLGRLLSAPAGRWPFPTLSPQSPSGRLDPYPAASLSISVRLRVPPLRWGHRFLARASAWPQSLRARHAKCSLHGNFHRVWDFGVAVIR